jgi:hypothetical protein
MMDGGWWMVDDGGGVYGEITIKITIKIRIGAGGQEGVVLGVGGGDGEAGFECGELGEHVERFSGFQVVRWGAGVREWQMAEWQKSGGAVRWMAWRIPGRRRRLARPHPPKNRA